MEKKQKIINEGGINGTGEGVVNINSSDYKELQKSVQAHYKSRDKQDIIRFKVISLRLQMESYIADHSPKNIKPPGFFLKEFISAIGIKNKEFAKFVHIEESNLSAIINGKRKINTELAFILGLTFDLNPNHWLLIQSKNELHRIREKENKDFNQYNLENLLKKAG